MRYVDGMTEALSLAGMRVMCEGKDQSEFVSEVPCSPRGEEILRMRQELEAARRSIAEKDEKMCRLTRIQDTVDAEVQELTEKLFQEAYRMVNYAEERRERSEKLLNESRLQVEVLSAEVAALKLLVQTPGMGQNHFQHTSPEHKSALAKLFSTTSAKRSSSSGAVPTRKASTLPPTTTHLQREKEREIEQKQAEAVEEVDPILMLEFTSWRDAGHPLAHHPFMDRVNIEEIAPCMLFSAKELSDAVFDSIAANKLELEPVHEDKPHIMPCALTNVSRFCPYRVRVSEDAPWHRISLLARNRIAAVCDYFTFIRYLRAGLIKSGIRDAYFDVMQLRRNMCLAKLGLGFVPKTNLRPGF
ncbi:hypothetical protein V3C99_010554 [Haemonchus contortus]